ncbi:MAG: antitoxin VbhA family protein [Agathobacter sp.]|nr:antitoxin VbhA family protein [Agathobacter sp.]
MLPVQAILDTTKASFAMEGMYATEYDEKNITDVLTGNRSLEEVVKEIKSKYISEKE